LVSQVRSKGWLYTAASRATSRAGLEVEAEKIDERHIEAVRHDIECEMCRLAVLHAHTRLAAAGNDAAAKKAIESEIADATAAWKVARRALHRQNKEPESKRRRRN